MSILPVIEKKLCDAFDPTSVEVINESHLHAGHQPGFDGTGESHIRIKIVAKAFDSMTRVQRHREINALVSDEIAGGLHAIAIDARGEAEVHK